MTVVLIVLVVTEGISACEQQAISASAHFSPTAPFCPVGRSLGLSGLSPFIDQPVCLKCL